MKKIRENFKKTLKISGVKVDFLLMEEVVEKISEWLKSGGSKKYLVTPNPEIITFAQKDEKFKEILNRADLAIPDGTGVLCGMRLMGEKRGISKVTGIDLMMKLCQLAPKKGWKIGLIGGYEVVAEKTREKLKEMFPGIKIVFCESGGEVDRWGNQKKMNVIPSEASQDTVRIEVKVPTGFFGRPPMAERPQNDGSELIDILFVGFGFPKQEYWIDKNKEKFPAKVFIPVGGAFDYVSGRIKRAPLWVQKIGLEWLYRLICEPWRIKRQLAGAKFFFLVLKEKFNK